MTAAGLEIRTAVDEDWPRIYPFFSEIVERGETYAYPAGLTLERARPWWMEQPPGCTFVAVLDVMHRTLPGRAPVR